MKLSQVTNNNGLNNDGVQESSNTVSQVQVGSGDVQAQNSEVVTDQNLLLMVITILFLKQVQMIQLNLKLLLMGRC